MKYIIGILILIAIFICLMQNKRLDEPFENSHSVPIPMHAPRATFFRLNNNQPLYEDSLFVDVTTFDNDYNPSLPGQKTALQKCMENCDSHCVENGPGNSATCFPRNTRYLY